MPKRAWTAIEDECMRRFYPDLTGADMADVLKRSERSVYNRAKTLGLRKSEAFLASDRSGRVTHANLHPSMVASRFKPGQTASDPPASHRAPASARSDHCEPCPQGERAE